jgi:hypothetical protein
MKKRILALVVVLTTGIMCAQAQRISVRLNFPGGMHTRAYGRAPVTGSVWIGPEWQWRDRRYVSVPGYWTTPVRRGAIWVPGHWQGGRRGYRWIPGHWR